MFTGAASGITGNAYNIPGPNLLVFCYGNM